MYYQSKAPDVLGALRVLHQSLKGVMLGYCTRGLVRCFGDIAADVFGDIW